MAHEKLAFRAPAHDVFASRIVESKSDSVLMPLLDSRGVEAAVPQRQVHAVLGRRPGRWIMPDGEPPRRKRKEEKPSGHDMLGLILMEGVFVAMPVGVLAGVFASAIGTLASVALVSAAFGWGLGRLLRGLFYENTSNFAQAFSVFAGLTVAGLIGFGWWSALLAAGPAVAIPVALFLLSTVLGYTVKAVVERISDD